MSPRRFWHRKPKSSFPLAASGQLWGKENGGGGVPQGYFLLNVAPQSPGFTVTRKALFSDL